MITNFPEGFLIVSFLQSELLLYLEIILENTIKD